MQWKCLHYSKKSFIPLICISINSSDIIKQLLKHSFDSQMNFLPIGFYCLIHFVVTTAAVAAYLSFRQTHKCTESNMKNTHSSVSPNRLLTNLCNFVFIHFICFVHCRLQFSTVQGLKCRQYFNSIRIDCLNRTERQCIGMGLAIINQR